MDKPLVLVVDDEHKLADYIAKMVAKTGKYDALAAYNAEDAFQALKKNKRFFKPNRVGLILLDIKMPDMDGLQFLEKLRQSYDEDQVGVIMVTAYEDEDKWEKATDGFICGYIKKPIDEKELMAAIDKFYCNEEARHSMTLNTFEKHIDKMEEFKKTEKTKP